MSDQYRCTRESDFDNDGSRPARRFRIVRCLPFVHDRETACERASDAIRRAVALVHYLVGVTDEISGIVTSFTPHNLLQSDDVRGEIGDAVPRSTPTLVPLLAVAENVDREYAQRSLHVQADADSPG